MKASNYVVTVRQISGRKRHARFLAEPGPTTYLEVPDGDTPHPIKHKRKKKAWLGDLIGRAEVGRIPNKIPHPYAGYTYGDILVYVHGYNNSTNDVMHRHNLLQKNLANEGFRGAIVSFDWPSANSPFNYLEDKEDAIVTARHLVDDMILPLARRQLIQHKIKCAINLHLLGHSLGAYVIQEAFFRADENPNISLVNWSVDQIAFIAADIPQGSLTENDSRSVPLFSHSQRITNYQNPHDSVLPYARDKDRGRPRAGRVGIPEGAPRTLHNVNVGKHWSTLSERDSDAGGVWSHSWHFDDRTFAKDLVHTLAGDTGREIPTRKLKDGEWWLVSST